MTEHPDHRHHHRAGSDLWSVQHAEKGAAREPRLAPATQALLRCAQVEAGDRVLDVATGAGDTAAAATAAGAQAMGIDTSEAMVRIARERFPETAFEVGDMTTPPAGPWDGIVCRLGAHHAQPSWLSAAFSVLKSGGRIAVAERDGLDPRSRERGMLSLGEWIDTFVEVGFTEVKATPTGAELDGRIYVISGRKP